MMQIVNDILKYINDVLKYTKRFSTDNMKGTGLYGYVYNFSVDYDRIDPDDILGIHKYLMKKHNIKCLDLLRCIYITIF